MNTKMSTIQLVLSYVVSLVVVHVTVAQNSPADFLHAHNIARAQVAVGAMVWNTTVAAYAQNYANRMAYTCNLAHSIGGPVPYGKNLASAGSRTFTGTEAVNLWVSEKQYYTSNTRLCASGEECSHYLQVIWPKSVHLGCARVVCNNNVGTLIICSYDPPERSIYHLPQAYSYAFDDVTSLFTCVTGPNYAITFSPAAFLPSNGPSVGVSPRNQSEGSPRVSPSPNQSEGSPRVSPEGSPRVSPSPNHRQRGSISTFIFTNKCNFTVWPGILTSQGKPLYPTTGFELAAGASQSSQAPANWEGRFWGRTGCNRQFTCKTGSCGAALECNGAGGTPPVTLGEIRLNGDAGKDFYDINNVDGYNIPMSITPDGGGCTSISCSANVNSVCPPELRVVSSNGNRIACKSACLSFNQPQYCCTGEFNTPETCKPTGYSRIFKNACPQAYSYAFDDATSLYTCATGANYTITFCP